MKTTASSPAEKMHANQQTWLSNLDFYKDEIKILTNRLGMVVNLAREEKALPQLEHFQNQLIIQKEQLDILRHNINESERHIEGRVEYTLEYNKLKEQVVTYEKLFNKLRHEMNLFFVEMM